MGGEGDPKYTVDETRRETGTDSTLTVKDVTEDDLGAYVCKVANSFGTDSAAIHLRRKSKQLKARLHFQNIVVLSSTRTVHWHH